MTSVMQDDILGFALVWARHSLGRDLRFRNHNLQRVLSSAEEARELFIFSSSGPEPFSPDLDESLNRLTVGGFISRPDLQDPEKVAISKGWFDSDVEAFTPHLPGSVFGKIVRLDWGLSSRDLKRALAIADFLVNSKAV